MAGNHIDRSNAPAHARQLKKTSKIPKRQGWAPVENASDASKAIDVAITGIATKATAPTFFEKRNAVITGGGHNRIRPINGNLKCIRDKSNVVCLQCAHLTAEAIIGSLFFSQFLIRATKMPKTICHGSLESYINQRGKMFHLKMKF